MPTTHEQLEKEAADLRSENKRLREALRSTALLNLNTRDNPTRYWCSLCHSGERIWRYGEPEIHKAGCLAAPKE